VVLHLAVWFSVLSDKQASVWVQNWSLTHSFEGRKVPSSVLSGSDNFNCVGSLSSALCYKDHCACNVSNFIGRYKIWQPDDICLRTQIITSFCLAKNYALSGRHFLTILLDLMSQLHVRSEGRTWESSLICRLTTLLHLWFFPGIVCFNTVSYNCYWLSEEYRKSVFVSVPVTASWSNIGQYFFESVLLCGYNNWKLLSCCSSA
jgi:hypothetical protein